MTATSPSASSAATAHRAARNAGEPAISLRHCITLWRMRMQGRRLLLEMDERLLKDVGLTRPEAAAEGMKPWWRS